MVAQAGVFTPADRGRLRKSLVSSARSDPRITGIALTGSGALGEEDRWSDIDLAFGVATIADFGQVVEDWSRLMYGSHGAVHHMDMAVGTTTYRVFFLASTLQVDLAFWPAAELGATGPAFKLLAGAANERPAPPAPGASQLIGWAWLYALHARSSIQRGRPWQAEYMISGLRDQVLALACLRHGLPTGQARGIDRLPSGVAAALVGALVTALDAAELKRAFRVAIDALIAEVRRLDEELAARLSGPLLVLTMGDGEN